MMNEAHALARDEQIHAITVFSGWATADGLAGGTTIEDSKLKGLNDFVTGKSVLIMSGPCAWEMKTASSFVSGTGVITLPAFSAQITAGTLYRILTVGAGGLGVVVAGAYAHQIGVGEADALVVAAANRQIDVRFDMNALLQTTTVREYEEVDGANYRLITSRIFPTDFDVGCKAVNCSFVQAGALYKITFQSSLAEAGIINVPYRSMVRAV